LAHRIFTIVNMSKQPTNWDHEAHLVLLQAVMAEAPPSPVQWDKILDRVTQKGYRYTASAAMYGNLTSRFSSLLLFPASPSRLPHATFTFPTALGVSAFLAQIKSPNALPLRSSFLSQLWSQLFLAAEHLGSNYQTISFTISHFHTTTPPHTVNMSERMNWDHHADHDLLTAMMQELQPSQEQLRGVMTRMHAFGYTCTVKAITY
jgi:hypothetical protein